MCISMRGYCGTVRFGADYEKARSFLLRCGAQPFTYARWDWMIMHPNLDENAVDKLAFWNDGNETAGMALFDCTIDDVFLQVLPGYETLYPEMIAYACKNLCSDEFALVIPEDNRALSGVAASAGFIATPQRDCYAAFFPQETTMDYVLPEGYAITDMAQDLNLFEYARVLWKGFNHELDGEGELPYSPEYEAHCCMEMCRPNADLDLKVAVRAPDGHFAAYCGLWYDRCVDFAVIEPVATDPAYRRMGLGRAALLEGIRRAVQKGAQYVLVGSQQQFYYNIGLRPFSTAAKWCKR